MYETYIYKGSSKRNIFFNDTVYIGGFDSVLLIDLNFDNKLDIDFRGTYASRSGSNWMHAFFINKDNKMKYINASEFSHYKLDKQKRKIYNVGPGGGDFDLSEWKWVGDSLRLIKRMNIKPHGKNDEFDFPKEYRDIERLD
jgi:hypothetical protein